MRRSGSAEVKCYGEVLSARGCVGRVPRTVRTTVQGRHSPAIDAQSKSAGELLAPDTTGARLTITQTDDFTAEMGAW